MKTIKATILTVLSILILLTLLSSTAYAITGNFKPDSTPYVGVVVCFSDTAKTHPISYSTGFLVSPTVMVTAGHSLLGAAAVSVCFDSGPIDFEIAADGTLVYQGNSPIYDGTPVLYPGYTPTLSGNQEFSTSDIGIIQLKESVSGVTAFPALPKAGLTETLTSKTDLKVIGYGFQTQATPKNNGVMNSWIGTLSRNSAQTQLSSANFAGNDKYLKLSANAAQNKGGICFGDSGGPEIYTDNNGKDFAVAVNAFVNNANCGGVSYHTRIDVPIVLDWIKGYLA